MVDHIESLMPDEPKSYDPRTSLPIRHTKTQAPHIWTSVENEINSPMRPGSTTEPSSGNASSETIQHETLPVWQRATSWRARDLPHTSNTQSRTNMDILRTETPCYYASCPDGCSIMRDNGQCGQKHSIEYFEREWEVTKQHHSAAAEQALTGSERAQFNSWGKPLFRPCNAWALLGACIADTCQFVHTATAVMAQLEAMQAVLGMQSQRLVEASAQHRSFKRDEHASQRDPRSSGGAGRSTSRMKENRSRYSAELEVSRAPVSSEHDRGEPGGSAW